MTAVFVQFSDATETVVSGVFACAQDPKDHPNQGEIDDSDPRYQAFINPASTLAGAQAAKVAALVGAYQSAIAQPVNFTTAGGVAKAFQADANSIANLQAMLAAFTPAGKAPTGFYWVAADNTQVPFTLADMQGLAASIGAQGWTSFQHLQAQKAAVLAATTVSAVNAISW